jgi:APA family basic amino acid/polyamine antiporter
MIFYLLCTAAGFVLRKKMPDAERPYRVLGYPVVPILFILSASLILVSTLLGARGDAAGGFNLISQGSVLSALGVWARNPAISGAVLIAAGLPVYWLWTRLATRNQPK